MSGRKVRRLLLPLLISLAAGPAAAVDGTLAPLQLVRLARSLGDAPDPMRRDFAWLALNEMVSVYTEEAARARREARGTARARDQARWAAAVDAYAAKMTALAASMSAETQVRINIGPGNSVYVFMDGQPAIVTGVIGGQQAAYEQRVLERFCMLYLCAELLEEPQATGPPETKSRSGVHWSFSQHAGPACVSDDGLELQFRDMSELKKKRRACDQIVADLNALAAAIGSKIAAGVRIDWNRLKITPRPDDRQQVILNGEGASIHIPLHALVLTPDLFRILRPWLAARTAGNSYRQVVLNAEPLVEPLTATYGWSD